MRGHARQDGKVMLIGAPGFEPGTSATQRPRATRLRHAPMRPSVGRLADRAGLTVGQPLGFAAMADVQPLNALHYDLDAVGSLQDVVAPPYDVIDAATRAELIARSPYNAVAIDLPKPYGETGPQAAEGDPYERAAKEIDAWQKAGALVKDAEPAIWAMEQEYTGPDGSDHIRHAILARVRVEDFETGQVLPHERTLPGPKQDRLELMRTTRCNLSPIFSLSTLDPWPLVQREVEVEDPWGE